MSSELRYSVKAETVFRASDNSVHPDRNSAEMHEMGLNLRRLFLNLGFRDERGEIKAFCAVISEKYDVFNPIFSKMKVVHSRKKKEKSL